MICIDQSHTCRTMIEHWLPNAAIAADRLQALRLVGLHLLRLVRQLRPTLGGNRAWFGVLRRHRNRLDPAQRRAQLFARYPQLMPAYEMKKEIRKLLCLKGRSKRASRQRIPELLHHIMSLSEGGTQAALTLAKALSDRREENVCMGRFSRNNGITARFHRKMELTKRLPLV